MQTTYKTVLLFQLACLFDSEFVSGLPNLLHGGLVLCGVVFQPVLLLSPLLLGHVFEHGLRQPLHLLHVHELDHAGRLQEALASLLVLLVLVQLARVLINLWKDRRNTDVTAVLFSFYRRMSHISPVLSCSSPKQFCAKVYFVQWGREAGGPEVRTAIYLTRVTTLPCSLHT